MREDAVMVAEPEVPEASQPTPAIPDALPVLPLRGGTVIFPFIVAPLTVGQERSVRLVDDVMRRDRLVAVVASHAGAPETPGPDELHRVGTAATVLQLVRVQDGTLRLLIQGLERIRLLDFLETEPYLVAEIEEAPERTEPREEIEALQRAVIDVFRRLVLMADELQAELVTAAENLADPLQVVYLVASSVAFSPEVRQELLELDRVDAKLRRLVELIQHEIAVRELGQKITSDTAERLSKTQRDFYLRQQLESIQRALGEEDQPELADLRRQIEEVNLPEDARREAERELARLATIPAASPEHGIIRTYLEWMASLPWTVTGGGLIDVALARRVLDEDHYDLEKVKDRILEYLAVKKLRRERFERLAAEAAAIEAGEASDTETVPGPNRVRETDVDRDARDPILCFVGPPGVGKTSLGQSIARALGRKFVRVSLGGVHDEAEIRGHRRTYIGALPGRIIQALRRSGTRDPVFMFDEIDKIGADWRGDPSSALLEVLDPAQNDTFVDNYLGVPFDLSQVLFIATGNTVETIPDALRDRLEILQLSGYTDLEKIEIAERYLVRKQLTAHGLQPGELTFEREALRTIIRGYTREAGVRSLDRQIAAVSRKVARAIVEGAKDPVFVTPAKVATYLGRPRFFDEVSERTDRPGVATGLAWTPGGGDVLFVEATFVPSAEERLILTGMLGDVMRESAQAALSFVRSNARDLGIGDAVFEHRTVHLHVPAGAIPKDGPSAGVAMVVALASLAAGRPVRSDVAVTGEITLRGAILPVGGIREKVLAAHRAGIRRVLLPRRNEADLEDVPTGLRDEIAFVLLDQVEQAILEALEPLPTTIAAGVGGF
jgi:ATP-dependent Lon protease